MAEFDVLILHSCSLQFLGSNWNTINPVYSVNPSRRRWNELSSILELNKLVLFSMSEFVSWIPPQRNADTISTVQTCLMARHGDWWCSSFFFLFLFVLLLPILKSRRPDMKRTFFFFFLTPCLVLIILAIKKKKKEKKNLFQEVC